jgi:hypothetical protein
MNNSINLYWLTIYVRSGAWKKAVIAIVAVFTLGLASCAQPTSTSMPQSSSESTQPDAIQAVNSQDAADITATAVGTESGGAGMVLGDALTLARGGMIPDAVIRRDASDTSTVHSVTVTRTRSKNGYGFSGTWIHTWTFYDASGNAMPKFVKGQTDKVVITTYGVHTVTTPRVSTADSSIGTWTISNLIAEPDSATLNGTLTRAGSTTHSPANKVKTHTLTIDWTNDILVKGFDRDVDDTITYILGNANSDFTAVGSNGNTFEREDSIVFHGNGTATLTITRTTGNGKTDTFTIDVKRGIWFP